MNAITEEEAARRRNRAAEYVARHARKCAEYDERKAWLDAEAAKPKHTSCGAKLDTHSPVSPGFCSAASQPHQGATMKTKYIVQTSAAAMPNSCWGVYKNVAILEVPASLVGRASMISERSRNVVAIYWHSGPLNCGTTPRAAHQNALAWAHKRASELNSERDASALDSASL